MAKAGFSNDSNFHIKFTFGTVFSVELICACSEYIVQNPLCALRFAKSGSKHAFFTCEDLITGTLTTNVQLHRQAWSQKNIHRPLALFCRDIFVY